MVTNMFRNMGATKATVNEYKKGRLGYEHAWLAGVRDPYPGGCLPDSAIYIPGLPGPHAAGVPHLFVTRSPCVLPGDGRLHEHVRLDQLGKEAAGFLSSLSFGCVIFGRGTEGASMPACTAEGDLDGNLYIVCWSKKLISKLTVLPRNEKRLVMLQLRDDECAPVQLTVTASHVVMARRKRQGSFRPRLAAELQPGDGSGTSRRRSGQ